MSLLLVVTVCFTLTYNTTSHLLALCDNKGPEQQLILTVGSNSSLIGGVALMLFNCPLWGLLQGRWPAAAEWHLLWFTVLYKYIIDPMCVCVNVSFHQSRSHCLAVMEKGCVFSMWSGADDVPVCAYGRSNMGRKQLIPIKLPVFCVMSSTCWWTPFSPEREVTVVGRWQSCGERETAAARRKGERRKASLGWAEARSCDKGPASDRH